MLAHVVDILSQVVSPIVVVAAPGQEVPLLAQGVEIIRDEEGGRGPLQGLAAGLAGLEGKAAAAYVSSCDVPFLRSAFVVRLIELLGDHLICVPHVEDRHHPLAAVYRIDVKQAVSELIADNRMRPFFLFEIVRTRVVEAEELQDIDPTFESLRNVNTPEEYEAAMAEFATRSIPRTQPQLGTE
jgi:molybdopterin-guanine dinucleotide biosynthesis protein A